MIFSYFKHDFIFLNINERQAVLFAELTRHVYYVSPLCFFGLYRITCQGIPAVTQD